MPLLPVSKSNPPASPLDYAQFDKFKPAIDAIIRSHRQNVEGKVTLNRNKRHLYIDTPALRDSGSLDRDETFIADRVIDRNIQREIPPLIEYLVKPSKVAIFLDLDDKPRSTEELQSDFTDCVRYDGWILPVYRMIDAMEVHGYAALEVCFDESKRGKVSFYDIGTENLYLPSGAINIQSLPMLAIRVELTSSKLLDLKTQGFDPDGIDTIINRNPDVSATGLSENPFAIFKCYFRINGIVHVAWYANEYNNQFLKPPEPLDCGIKVKQDTTQIDPLTGAATPSFTWASEPQRDYPIFLFPYRITEDKRIIMSEGRARLDASKQEAQCVLWSTFCNGAIRASNVYGSPETEAEPGTSVELLDVVLQNGRIYNQPLKFFSMPYPPTDILRASNALDTKMAEELGQVNFAVNNRVDSRKTATEVAAASKESDTLDTVDIVLFSANWQNVLLFAWKIIRSQALLGNIKLGPQIQVANVVPAGLPMPGIPAPPTTSNDTEFLSHTFRILPAGDTEIIERQERIQKMQQAWPIIATFPQLAVTFLGDLLKDMFPERGPVYAKILEESGGANLKQLAVGLYQMLESLIQENPQVQQLPSIQKALPQIEAIGQQLGVSQPQPQQT